MDITQQAERVIEAMAHDEEEYGYDSALPPERVAWLVLLAAFALFCAVAFSSIFAVYQYLFQSTVPLPATLKVAKGTIGITPGCDLIEEVERASEDLTNTLTCVSTDSLSQATIQFRSSNESETLLAAVTLQGNTSGTFNQANQPRFDLSPNPKRVQFSNLQGTFDIFVTGIVPGGRQFYLTLHTDALDSEEGAQVQIRENGRYRLTVSEDELHLHTLAGTARVFFKNDLGSRQTTDAGEELVLRLGARSSSSQATTENILPNGAFTLVGAAGLADWQCNAIQALPPVGDYSLQQYDGRRGLRLRRLDNAATPGAVTCIQEIEAERGNLRAYDSLRVLATFNALHQNLDVCGELASECPLMLRIDYLDQYGRAGEWLRGFYYEPSDSERKRCASCLQDHIETNQDVWYTFESDNLFNLIAEDNRPVQIKTITFYASGHQFDTVVSEMALLLGRAAAEADA